MLFPPPLVWQKFSNEPLYVYQIHREDSFTPHNLEATLKFGRQSETRESVPLPFIYLYENFMVQWSTLSINYGLLHLNSVLMHVIKRFSINLAPLKFSDFPHRVFVSKKFIFLRHYFDTVIVASEVTCHQNEERLRIVPLKLLERPLRLIKY